jgi:hypothetical protein
MAWINKFRLGRPGKEAYFDQNPRQMTITDERLTSTERGLLGEIQEATTSRNRPGFRLSSRNMTSTMWNQLRSLLLIEDTPLLFIPSDLNGVQVFESWQEVGYPGSATLIQLPDNSFLKASALRCNALGQGETYATVRDFAVYATYAPDSKVGTTSYPVLKYNSVGRWLSLQPPGLPNMNPVFVTYRVAAVAVAMREVAVTMPAGFVNRAQYEMEFFGS